MIKAIPSIQRNPRTVSQNALHYGYVAYQDIQLGHHQVQPDTSPYHKVLPKRELIPFTNIEVGEIDEKQVQNPKRPKGVPPVKIVQKTAFECAQEMEVSYADWAFQILKPLTGLPEDQAFRIFQTVQPFTYKLRDAQAHVGDAESRIEQDEPYTVSYEGETITLQPLSNEEKEIARKVQEQVLASINQAFELGTDKFQKTVTSMTRAFSGGDGKVTPDPLDRNLAKDFGTKLPQLVDVQKLEEEKKTEADSLEREKLEIEREKLELQRRQIALLEAQEARETQTDTAKTKAK